MTWRSRVGLPGMGRVRSRPVRSYVRDLLLHNLGLKLLSIVAAFSLWVFVNVGERDTEGGLQIPVELRNIPRNLMIVSPRVNFIDLRISGPRTLLSRVSPSALAVVLDLNGVRPGPAVFRVQTDALDLPRGVTVVRVAPSEISLELARIERRVVPVHVALSGKPPNGLRVTDIKVAPETIEVIGPANEVEQVKAVETAALDLSDAQPGVIERELTLESMREHLSLTATLVHAQVLLEEPEQTRVFKKVPIVVRNSAHRATVRPERLTVTVRGPRSATTSLELEHGAVYIDATGLEPGGYTLTPSVDLPADVELLKQEPANVQLRVSRETRRSHGS